MLRFEPGNNAQDPNILTALTSVFPNVDGSWRYQFGTVASSFSTSTFSSTSALNAFLGVAQAGTSRLFVGTTKRIYEATGGSGWTDQSAGAADYTLSTSWHFIQYASQTIACNLANATQQSSSGAFAALSNAPKALCGDTLNDQIILWNINDGAAKQDTISICDISDSTQWTPTSGKYSYTTRLTDCPGPGTAAIRFRNFIVAFKRRGMWLGQYVGLPNIWHWQLFSADVGCVGKDACIVAGDVLYFMDDKNVFAFDGATVRSITDPYVTKSLITNASGLNVTRICAHYDDLNKVVSFYYGTSVILTNLYAYNTVSQQWSGPHNSGGAASTFDYCFAPVRAAIQDIAGFSGSLVTVSSNENRFNVYDATGLGTTFGLRNGHGQDGGGSATSAYFGSFSKAQHVERIYMNADSNTGVSVTITGSRAPKSGASAQSTSGSVSLNADMQGDARANGNFLQLTWAFSTSSVFKKWLGYELPSSPAGTR